MIRASGSGRGVAVRALGPLALYVVLSVGIFGIPVLGHLGSRTIASDQIDPSVLIWMLAWWPHALLHGLNPFVTHAIFYPDGYNLTWSTSLPLPSVVLAPITLGFGPTVSWNVLQLLTPALSAWTAFLLCRYVSGRLVPSLVGGYLFGFSPYVLVHLTGSPHLGMVALLPVFVLLVLRHLDGASSPRRFIVTMTLALTAQYLIGTEVLAASTLFGGFALLLAIVLLPEHRDRLLQTIKLLVIAYGATLVLVSPFLYYFLFGTSYPPAKTNFPADLAAFALPPRLVAVQLHAGPPYIGSDAESYLGLPLILLIVSFVWRRRRDRAALLPALCLLVAAVASLGDHLLIRGHKTSVWLPWRALEHLPVLRYLIPVRFALFVFLPAALILAMWLGERRRVTAGIRWTGPARWGLVALVVIAIVPSAGNAAWDTPIADPPFFQHGAYRDYLNAGDHVLTVPALGPNERWLADTGIPFSLTAGYLGQAFPAGYNRFATWNTLLTGRLTPGYAAALRRFLAAKQVTAIVVDKTVPGPWNTLFGTLGVRPVDTGGVLLYRLKPRSTGPA